MYPIIARIGGVVIYSHGLMIILGVVISSLVLVFLTKRAKLSRTYLLDNISSVILMGIIGARFFYVIFYYKELKNFWQIFYIWQGGLVSWGGILVGLLTLIWLLHRQNQPVVKWLDIVAVSAMLGLAIGRIGCYLTGDIPGRVTSAYPGGFPVTAYESIIELILFIVVLLLYLRFNKLRDGTVFIEVIFGYSLIRLVIDGFRDSPLVFVGLNSGQLTALTALSLIVIFIIWQLFRRRYGRQ